MKQRLTFYAALLCFSFVIICGVISDAQANAERTKPEVEQFVSTIGSDVVTIIQTDGLSDDLKETRLKSIFRNVVDLDWIGRFVLARYWNSATDEQKERYLNGYREFLVNNYTSRFREYSGETFDIKKSYQESNNKYAVLMELVRPGEANVNIYYKLRKSGGQYKVYDIIVEGVSLITTQRSEFGSVVSRKGLDFLINVLE